MDKYVKLLLEITQSFQLGTSSERHQVLGTNRGTHFVTSAVDGACGFQSSRV